ncbi:Protein of unknown function [Pyronema omphalodes CBS 100304]|uniref:Uncharacterized protein n=1 Tax=Pyronema omphalodes (strain CBS 100304) TaxID=1076935 RepID=U4LG16_PYROM|nr:Protein of unknown function [Pyronema omphalodes CBS 100304]
MDRKPGEHNFDGSSLWFVVSFSAPQSAVDLIGKHNDIIVSMSNLL